MKEKTIKYSIDNESSVSDKISAFISIKNDIVYHLIDILKETKDESIRKQAALALVDHFKDKEILPVFKELINNSSLAAYNAILVYAIDEYVEFDKNDLISFFIDSFIKHDYHVAWNAHDAILDILNTSNVDYKSLLLSIRKSYDNMSEDKKELAEDLITVFEWELNKNSQNEN